MAICLEKGQKIDLTKGNAGLSEVLIGLGWDVNAYDGATFDLDASAFLIYENGKSKSPNDFVFYKNLSAPGIRHLGDNLTGAGDGDDEQLIVKLDDIPLDVKRVIFTITIYDGESKKQNFGQVSNAFVRVVNNGTNEELIRYDLGEDYSIETALVVGELYRHGTEWKFGAIGSGFQGGLAALLLQYGLN